MSGRSRGLRSEEHPLPGSDGSNDPQIGRLPVSGSAAPRDPTPEDAPTAGLGGDASPVGGLPWVQPGQILAGRYRILRFIAGGGMGEVYEAEDVELGERVALKTVRPRFARDAHAIERFKREIHLARKVTHPHVCRIFEFGQHRAPDGGELVLLTMELLSGETLAERIHRRGPLSPTEARSLLGQMGEALAAAHAAGVVHRDFKSANVMLVPNPDGTSRAVVTDFGLAQGAIDPARRARLGEPRAGTPDYMAPEQVQGGEVSPATDIYALGIVLFEMLTGRRPFATARERLERDPPSPRSDRPELDARWDAAVRRCLARRPEDRFADAGDVVRAVDGGPSRFGRRPLLRAAAAVALAVGATALGYALRRPAARLKPRPAVAVLPFKDLAPRPDSAWLSTALAELLRTELAAGQKLRTVPGEDVARARVELSLPETDSLARDTLERLHRNLGSDMVVLGSYLATGDPATGPIRLDVHVQDATAGETIANFSETGTGDQILALVSRAGERLRESLGLSGLSPTESGGLRASLPSRPEAARLYLEGLARLRAFDALAARDLLQRAVGAEPDYPLAHAALAEAWALLGNDTKAREAAKTAFGLSRNLPREARLVVEGRYREVAADWGKAAEIYRVLFGFFPDNLDYGLRLAAAESAAGSGDRALATLAELRRLPPPDSEDPRIDLAEAAISESTGSLRQERDAARRAAEKAVARGTELLVARARLREAYALGRLGDGAAARKAAEQARAIYARAGDRGGLAWSINRLANTLLQAGRLVEALKRYEEARQVFQEVGYQGGFAAATSNTAYVMLLQGRLQEAARRLARTEAVDEEVGDRSGQAKDLANLGNVRYEQARLREALASYERARALCREVGDEAVGAIVLQRTADVLASQGSLETAEKRYREAVQVLRRTGNRRYVGFALSGLGAVLAARGELDAARRTHREALEIRAALGDILEIAESRLALAQIDLDEDRPEAAIGPARAAATVFAKEEAHDSEARALDVVLRALLKGGRAGETSADLERARALAERSQSPAVRLVISIDAARRQTALGSPGEAVEALQTAAGKAAGLGLVGLALEARLASARAEAASGNAADARKELAALERDARAHGFDLLARQSGARLSDPRRRD